VDGPQLAGDEVGVFLGAEDNGVRRLERAPQPAEGIGREPAVVGHAGGHLRMSQLHEQGAAAAEEQDRFTADLADGGVVGEQAGHPVKVTFRRRRRAGSTYWMGFLGVVLVPAALLVVTVLLFVTAWLEENVLSPRSLILRTVRTRSRLQPEQVEQLVAAQSERLLRNFER